MVQVELKDHLSALHTALEELRVSQKQGEETKNGQELSGLVQLREKLDQLLQLQQPRGSTGSGLETADTANDTGATQLADVVALLNDAREQRNAQMEQQTDSIRYLNELNTVRISAHRGLSWLTSRQWLEAFVQHGTSQIEGVAAGVQHLCRELGPIPELQPPPDSEATSGEGGEGEGAESEERQPQPTQGGSLLTDIRRLLVENQARERSNADMHVAVQGLIAVVQEDMRRNAEARNQMSTLSTEPLTGGY